MTKWTPEGEEAFREGYKQGMEQGHEESSRPWEVIGFMAAAASGFIVGFIIGRFM